MIGGAVGVTAADGSEARLLPAAFFAVTLKIYAVPLVRPVTMHAVAAPLEVTQVAPPLEAVTV